MKAKCSSCSSYFDETLERCPNCGAPNEDLTRSGKGAPKTIGELKEWYKAHHLPPEEVTRFFIGKDIKEKRAFGIYYDTYTKKYVVYKNKDDGKRAIRYEGTDQAYAVNELYMKLKDEIRNQKRNQKGNKKVSKGTFLDTVKDIIWYIGYAIVDFIVNVFFFLIGSIGFVVAFLGIEFINQSYIPDYIYFVLIGLGIGFIVLAIILKEKCSFKFLRFVYVILLGLGLGLAVFSSTRLESYSSGYYHINDNYYYRHNDDWYIYNNSWIETEEPEYDGNLHSYYYSYSYDNDEGFTDFKDTSYWEDRYESSNNSSSNDWDSGSSWDSSDSWDSGGTDWSSDW